MLSVENLHLNYSPSRYLKTGKNHCSDAICDVNMTLNKGDFLAIIGPNGSGKSTLLRALAGAMKPRTGSIHLDQHPLQAYSPKVLARTIAFLPQGPVAPEDFTVRDLVGYGRFPHLGWSGRMGKKDKIIVEEALDHTRLVPLANRRVSDLSGGERQRTWIAMAMAQQAKLMILDEPTTFLDICFQLEVLEIVQWLNKSLGITVVIVLHDLNQAARFAKKIMVLHQGRVAQAGVPDQVLSATMMEEIFNITAHIRRSPHTETPYLIPIHSMKTKNYKKGNP